MEAVSYDLLFMLSVKFFIRTELHKVAFSCMTVTTNYNIHSKECLLIQLLERYLFCIRD